MSKTKTETPVLRNSADIPWEENRLYLPADETEEENKALYERLKKEIADGHPVDEYNNEVLCRLTRVMLVDVDRTSQMHPLGTTPLSASPPSLSPSSVKIERSHTFGQILCRSAKFP